MECLSVGVRAVCLVLLGSWWLVNCLKQYFLNLLIMRMQANCHNNTVKEFRSDSKECGGISRLNEKENEVLEGRGGSCEDGGEYHATLPHSLCRRKQEVPIETYLKIAIPLMAMTGELIEGLRGCEGVGDGVVHAHHAMTYFFYLLWGVVGLMGSFQNKENVDRKIKSCYTDRIGLCKDCRNNHSDANPYYNEYSLYSHGVPKPSLQSLDSTLLIIATLMHAFELWHDLHSRPSVDFQANVLQCCVIVMAAGATAVEACSTSTVPGLFRALLTLLQGTWYFQIWYLSGPAGDEWQMYSPPEQMVALMFSWHVAALLVLLLAMATLVHARTRNHLRA